MARYNRVKPDCDVATRFVAFDPQAEATTA